MYEIIVGCDETCVWREERPEARMFFMWDEIVRITASKLDCITQVDVVLEFCHESGHDLEINETWAGFDSIVDAVRTRFLLPANWYSDFQALKDRDASIVLWQHADYPTA